MQGTKFKAIKCKISRGGFSDERVFGFAIGNGEYSGVGSRRHMWGSDKQPLGEGEPPLGQTIEGFVAARVLKIDGSTAMVSIPDGETVEVPVDILLDRPTRVMDYVSI